MTATDYRHAAVFYAGRQSFLSQLVPFLRAGVAEKEPTLVVVGAEKIDALRGALGQDADAVEFADMEDVGANPARIIPAWRDFVEAHDGRRVRGIGEPIFPERRPAELTECQHHERLLNPALEGSSLFLVCPYDTEALPADVVDEARRSHPLVHRGGVDRASAHYHAAEAATGFFGEPLPEPDPAPETVAFTLDKLIEVRRLVRQTATDAGMAGRRVDQLVLAAGEIAANSARHGGGSGALRLWSEDDWLVCEISDAGRIDDPLLDRTRPAAGKPGGWGLWLANQMCDLVQLRSLQSGTVARLHMRTA